MDEAILFFDPLVPAAEIHQLVHLEIVMDYQLFNLFLEFIVLLSEVTYVGRSTALLAGMLMFF